MRKLLIVFCIFYSLKILSQGNYTDLVDLASETSTKNKTKDLDIDKKALSFYDEAFTKYPDSIDEYTLRKASLLASNIKNYDKAFLYLDKLVESKNDEEGFTGWRYLLDKDATSDYKNLTTDNRWNQLIQEAKNNSAKFYTFLREKEAEFFNVKSETITYIENSKSLYKSIQNYNPYLNKKYRNYSISQTIKDTIKNSFLVHLPANYNPDKKYKLLFFLHGAVKSNDLAEYQLARWNLTGWNRFYTKYADQQDVILVFPNADTRFNWLKPDDGFYMVPEILKKIKSALNIDDNRVFLSGHSNGATGSFSYLMKMPTEFAGFYGFNTYPKVLTGGTFIENIKNRSFINFSTDKDYYYPPNANDNLAKLMNTINADYKDYRYNGFPHWFPQFNESEQAFKILFQDLQHRDRNPFPKEISWEFDNDKYGNIDWLSNIRLDTLKQKQDWQKELNFKIYKWLEYDKNDSLVTVNVNKNAFDFPKKSGRIIAKYSDNIFRIKTSCIKSFRINISPEMVNPKKQVKVYVNGKLYYDKKIEYNRSFILENFKNTFDRKQIWIDDIKIDI